MVAPPAGTGSAGLLTYWSASSTVSSSLSLFWDNPNIRLGIGTSQPSSTLHIIAGTTGATTLQLMGLPNQTGNLLSIGSSSGQRYFTISSLGLASSTEFRSPSSTIDTLMLASASSTGNITIGGSFQANAGQSTFSNVSSTNLDVATRFNFSAASSTGNLTIGASFQSNAGQTTLASVSSTNLFGSGYLNFTSGRADLQAVSSTNLSASGYGLFPTLLAQNAVGLGSLSTSTSLVFIQGTQVGSTTLNIRGFTNQTANLFIVASSTGTTYFTIDQIGNVSSTQNLTIGGTFQANAGQSTFGSVSSTNAYHNGYLTVTGVTTVGNDLVFSGNNVIRRNTSDGSDTGLISLTGGGTNDITRGALLELNGNEATNGGKIIARIGNVSGSTFIITGGSGASDAFSLSGSDGSATFTSSRGNDGVGGFRAYNSQTTDHADNVVVGINTAAAASVTTVRLVRFFAGGLSTTAVGSIQMNNNAVSYNTTSDARLKTVVGPTTLGLDTLRQIPVEDFYFNADDQHRVKQGFMAQTLYQFYPEAVSVGGDDPTKNPWAVDYGRLTPLIIKSVQELDAKTASLSFRVEDLEHIIAGQASSTSASSPQAGSGQAMNDSSLFASVVSAFHDAYDIIFDKGLLKVAQIITDKLTAKEVITDKICVGVTCVTEDQLKTLLNNTGVTPISATPGLTAEASSTASSTSPIDESTQIQ